MALNVFFDTNDPFSGRHMLRRAPGYIDAKVLAASTAETITVPAGAKYVIFSAEADFWANPNDTAAVPSGDVSDGSASELNPVGYDVEGVSTISIISETAQNVSVTFYKDTP